MKPPKISDNFQLALFGTEPGLKEDFYGYEKNARKMGFCAIAGTDEAGRGPWAGPVVAAAVVLPAGLAIPYLNDSKQLTERRRNLLYDEIQAQAVSVAWSSIEPAVIDRINILQAARMAMIQSIEKLRQPIDLVLSDAMPLPGFPVPCISIIRGDSRSASIAAASIIAKVTRDRLMQELHQQYPAYRFDKHKGYGTAEHLSALRQFGPCPVHRKSFAPIKNWEKQQNEN